MWHGIDISYMPMFSFLFFFFFLSFHLPFFCQKRWFKIDEPFREISFVLILKPDKWNSSRYFFYTLSWYTWSSYSLSYLVDCKQLSMKLFMCDSLEPRVVSSSNTVIVIRCSYLCCVGPSYNAWRQRLPLACYVMLASICSYGRPRISRYRSRWALQCVESGVVLWEQQMFSPRQN